MPGSKQELVFLIGMPAVGKTWWGERIAAAHGWAFTDLDTYIATAEQASIPALFAQYGEKGFREKEHAYLKEIIATAARPGVIACGGGTPCFHGNIELMKSAGIVAYLEAEVPYLLHNLSVNAGERPLLSGRKDIAAYLSGLLETRDQWYRQAHYILQTKDISLTTFDEIISSCINEH